MLKNLMLSALCCVFLFSCEGQKVVNREVKSGNNSMLVGKIDQIGLTAKPYSDWFEPNYNDYTPDPELLKELRKKLKFYRIEVFMGTWCGDSKREIPAFFKILDESKFPKSRLTMYAVNRAKESFYSEEKGKDIRRVPTFIFYREGKEVNRIVESPVGDSLEQDIYSIISGKEYQPNYAQ